MELWTKGAQLGSINCHARLGDVYSSDDVIASSSYGVEKDKKLSIKHYEEAAMGGAYIQCELLDVWRSLCSPIFPFPGHNVARNNLGFEEYHSFRFSRAVKHFMFGAKMGCEMSLKNIRNMHTKGLASKEDYEEALTGYQEAVKERSSPERARAMDMLRARDGSK